MAEPLPVFLNMPCPTCLTLRSNAFIAIDIPDDIQGSEASQTNNSGLVVLLTKGFQSDET